MTDLFQETCPCCNRPYETESTSPQFAAFWARVPHKIGKTNAEKAWRKLSSADRANAAGKVQAFYDWFKANHRDATPLHPATYLNGKRWLDEPISGKSGAISEEANEAIRKALLSTIPAVREHAQRMAEKAGLI